MFLAVLSFFLFLAGCGNPADNTSNAAANTPVNKTAATPNTTAANNTDGSAAKKEMASVDLSDIDPSSAMPASSLNEKFSLKPDGWMGEKVAVSGLYRSYSTSEGVNAASAYRTDLKDKDAKTAVGCFSKERPAIWDDISKNKKYRSERIVVRGVVAGTVDYGDGPFVGLEPCEIVSK
jgi:hypothetical protein